MAYKITGLAIQYHSDQAMAAARKMRSTKQQDQKFRTSHMVCHHLKMMLNEPTAPPMTSAARAWLIGDINGSLGNAVSEQLQPQIQLGF